MVGTIHGESGLGEFYEAFLSFYAATKLPKVDPIAFQSWLETETEIGYSLGGAGGVRFFLDTVRSVELSTVDSVIKVLRHRANKRKQLNDIQALQQLISQKGKKSDEDIAKIAELTDHIRALESDLDYDPLSQTTSPMDIAEFADNLLEIPDFLPTPFKDYNRALGYTDDGGYFRGAVHAIVAMSGKGKSTLSKNLVNFWLDEGYNVLFINYEEAEAHWNRILMTQIIKENVYKRAPEWSQQQKADRVGMFKAKMEEWKDRLVVQHDPPSSYFEDLEIWLRDVHSHGTFKPDVVVIDTIQSLTVRGGGGVRWTEYEKMMMRLERLAREMDAAFILTAQQNTNAQKEKREVIEQQDVGGSISIVQKCSVITVLTEKKLATGDESDDDFLMQLQIPKNRITGATFMYDPPLIRYNDETKSYEDFEMIDEEVYGEAAEVLAADIFGLGDFNE